MVTLKGVWITKSTHKNKGKSFETNLVRLVSGLLIVLFIFAIVLYYSSIKSIYSEQLVKSNKSITEQMAVSFEIAMKQIMDNIYKTPLYDVELIEMLKNYNRDLFYQRDLVKKLDSIVMGNDYLYSAYLYLPKHNTVFSSEYANSYILEDFEDKQAIVGTKSGVISILDPRQVKTMQGKKLFISVVCPVPLYNTDYQSVLIINIDANKLYFDILRKIKTDENMDFYVYTSDGTMIINKDASLLFKKIDALTIAEGNHPIANLANGIFQKNRKITSTYYSQDLNWSFVLETRINTLSTPMSRLYSIIITFMFFLVVSLIVLKFIIKYSTKPMKTALTKYNEKLLVDFLMDNGMEHYELENQVVKDEMQFVHPHYAMILLQNLKTDLYQGAFDEYYLSVKKFLGNFQQEFRGQALLINKNQIALITNFPVQDTAEASEILLKEKAQALQESLHTDFKALTYAGVSSVKEGFSQLPAAYRECMEALNYKLCAGSHVIRYSGIRGLNQKLAYEYPYPLEKQLINNLIVGNSDACGIFMEKFFIQLVQPEYCLPDSEIKTYLYQLQTSVLKAVSSLPMQIKAEFAFNLLDMYDLDSIQLKAKNFILTIAAEINRKGENEESNMIHNIFEYIDRHFSGEDFNLNGAADELGLNRNYLARLVKEKSGSSFNDYISKKRIELAKSLLDDKSLSIEHIAHRVGFNYSNYFIRVFKSFEGVTPGQYRDSISSNLQ